MRKTLFSVAALAAVSAMSAPAQASIYDNFNITIENAGVQNTGTVFDYSGVVTFDDLSPGLQATPYNVNIAGTAITASYSNLNVKGADQYGAAGGSGNYAVAGVNVTGDYSITFNNAASPDSGINYFGFWLSALDSGNVVEFFNGASSLGVFNSADVIAKVGASGAYYGNPNAPFLGNNAGEPYVFVNFFLTGPTASFDKIVFSQSASNAGAGYESDNHTVGYWKQDSGTPIAPVPEPATWMMMISGIALVGGMMRREKAKVRFAAA